MPDSSRTARSANPSAASGSDRRSRFNLGLVVGFLAILGLVVLVTFFGVSTIKTMQDESENVVNNHMMKITLATEMYTSARQRIITMQKMTLIEDPFEQDELALKLDRLAADFVKARLALLEMPLSATEKQILDEQGRLTGQALPIQREIVDLIRQDDLAAAQRVLLNRAIPAQDRVLEILGELYRYQQEAAKNALANSHTTYIVSRQLMLWLATIVIVLGIIIATIVITRTTRSETEREKQLQQIETINKKLQEKSDEVVKAKEKIEQASRAKSAFLANMSHEIRTPLTAIIGFSESMLDSDMTIASRMDAINTVISSGKHLLKIINDILDLSKVEAEKLEIECIDVPLLTLVSEAQTTAELLAAEQGIGLRFDYTYPLPKIIQTDPVRLKQIIFNLLGNAIKFTEKGRVTLKVQYLRETDQVQFDVIDTGIGMSIEQQTRLFKPFAQADSSMTRKYGGTGLGLYLSRLLAERLGGGISLQSMPGRGSCFTITVSAATSDQTEWINSAAEEQTTDRIANTASPVTLTGNILMVEDNEANKKLIKLYIKRIGPNVDIASNGMEALEKVATRNYDLVLMDIQMPVMDGYETMRRLRAAGHTFPIVALTANAMKEDIEKCFAAGADEFLSKPIDFNTFSDTVSRLLDKTDMPAAVEDTGLSAEPAPLHSELLESEPELSDLVSDYIARLPGMVDAILAAHNQQDWDSLKRLAHDLKGSGGGYGFPQLTQLAAEIETDILASNHTAVTGRLIDLQSLVNRIQTGSELYKARQQVSAS